jgi:hypothetical protein
VHRSRKRKNSVNLSLSSSWYGGNYYRWRAGSGSWVIRRHDEVLDEMFCGGGGGVGGGL